VRQLQVVICLLLAVAVLPASSAHAQEKTDTQASDFVVGLNALNSQVKSALDVQPTNRVIVVPFKGTDSAYPRVSRFLADQLVTSLVSSGDYSILSGEEFHELLQGNDLSPMNIAGTPEFVRLAAQYENASIVVGTITDLDSKVAIMARIINSQSGQFSGGAMVYIKVADEFAALVDKDRPNMETAADEPETVDKNENADTKADVEAESKEPESTANPVKAKPETQPQQMQMKAPVMEGESAETIYRTAKQEFFDSGNYSEAIVLFERLVERHPDSDYADNAVYWIGESHYSMKQWQSAREQFQRVLDFYPYGNKVPDATMKRGYAEEKLGLLDEAIFSMEEVIRRFGSTSFADRARDKLQRLRALKQAQAAS